MVTTADDMLKHPSGFAPAEEDLLPGQAGDHVSECAQRKVAFAVAVIVLIGSMKTAGVALDHPALADEQIHSADTGNRDLRLDSNTLRFEPPSDRGLSSGFGSPIDSAQGGTSIERQLGKETGQLVVAQLPLVQS